MNFVNKYIGTDGLLHILVCIVIMQMLMLIFPTIWSIVITAIIGAVKEVIYDYYLKKGTASWKDFICDIVGIIIACI